VEYAGFASMFARRLRANLCCDTREATAATRFAGVHVFARIVNDAQTIRHPRLWRGDMAAGFPYRFGQRSDCGIIVRWIPPNRGPDFLGRLDRADVSRNNFFKYENSAPCMESTTILNLELQCGPNRGATEVIEILRLRPTVSMSAPKTVAAVDDRRSTALIQRRYRRFDLGRN